MKPELQRIAIAEACGWARTKLRESNGQQYPNGWENPKDRKAEMPDYLNDLNAMHEAEKVLTSGQLGIYLYWLDVACGEELAVSDIYCLVWHATAAQRAEAFLQTLNLLKP